MVRHIGSFMVAAVVLCSAAPSAAQTDPDLATVRANVKKATGTRPHDLHIESAYTQNGLSGTIVSDRSGDDTREESKFGDGLSIVDGSSGGVKWIQNLNGQTVIEPPDDAEPQPEATTESLTHVHAPADLYVISNLTAIGTGTKEYVDPTTWHVVRRDMITPNATYSTTFDDFRTTAGYTIAWHSVGLDEHPENNVNLTVTKVDTTTLPASSFAIPATRRNLVEFPAGVTSTQLPVQLVNRGSKFMVRVQIGKRGLDLMLDSGAGGIALERGVVKSLGLPEYGAYSNANNSGRYVSTRAIVPEIDVGPLKMHDVAVETIPPLPEESADYKIVGLLGFDFLAAIEAKLDYGRGIVTAYVPGTMPLPDDPRALDLDVRFGSFTPQTDITVNGALGTTFTLDTGGAGAILIFDYFRRRHPLETEGPNPKNNHRDAMYGVGGAFEIEESRIDQLKLGKVRFNDYDAYVIDSPHVFPGTTDGIVGPDLFRFFDLYLDYPDKKVYLSPNAAGSRHISR